VLGGTRSGKSRFGLRRTQELAGEGAVTYIATARSGDPELDERIRRHRNERPPGWTTVEASADIATDVATVESNATMLIDGLTLWLSALGDAPADPDVILDGPFARLLRAIAEHAGAVVVVSDEIGLGMVLMDASARAFRDLQGIAHQRLAEAADEVYLLVAGLPLTLKSR
jgi:adenosylcobinamide kinase / adenosylcobinamide-phosphate guanylyltransferase